MFMKHTALAAAALLLSAGASAQVGITADLGTTGAGFHLVVPMESNLNGRFGANTMHHDFNKTSDGVDYDIKGKLQTFDILFDWYLGTGSSFHLTGGLVYNGNRFDATANPNQLGSFTLNGTTYSAADAGILTGRIKYRKAAPYLGIGWGNALAPKKGWGFNADLGAFYQGKPDVTLSSVGCTASTAVCTALAGDVAAEQVRLRDDADAFKVYPVVRASLSYSF
jgi:hypothetical protein